MNIYSDRFREGHQFMDPLVSVIIPMYNAAKTIQETIESVIAQTYRNLEILVIDDGSTDRSAEIVTSLQKRHPYITYTYQKNAGVSAARNLGLEQAQGDYVAFLDADDIWQRDKLEKQLRRLTDTGYPACYSGYSWINEEGQPIGRQKNLTYAEGKILLDYLKLKNFASIVTWLVRKDILEANNIAFTLGKSFAEDVEFFIKVMALIPVCAVKADLTRYRIRQQSLSSFSVENQLTEIKTWESVIHWLKEHEGLYSSQEIEKAINIIQTFSIPAALIRILYHVLEERSPARKHLYVQIYQDPYYRHYLNQLKPGLSREHLKTYARKLRLERALRELTVEPTG